MCEKRGLTDEMDRESVNLGHAALQSTAEKTVCVCVCVCACMFILHIQTISTYLQVQLSTPIPRQSLSLSFLIEVFAILYEF